MGSAEMYLEIRPLFNLKSPEELASYIETYKAYSIFQRIKIFFNPFDNRDIEYKAARDILEERVK